MKTTRSANLQPVNGLALAAEVAALVEVQEPDELADALEYARSLNLPWRLIGQGTNSVPCDWEGVVVRMIFQGIQPIDNEDDYHSIRVLAGEDWSELVSYSLKQGWYGLENMAMIPGSAGAAPLQNIGAYGSELSDVLLGVDVFDSNTGVRTYLARDELGLSYRYCNLRNNPHLWVLAIHLQLSEHEQLSTPLHADVQRELEHLGIHPETAHPREVFESVCRVRTRKLPSPGEYPNVGSFFKNPCVDADKLKSLLEQHPELVHRPEPNGSYRLAAGWMLEAAGWKGYREGALEVWRNHALTLVNHQGQASTQQLVQLMEKLQDSVQQQFGVLLEPEPHIW